jgi:hypothetical protein
MLARAREGKSSRTKCTKCRGLQIKHQMHQNESEEKCALGLPLKD